jgi:hypothetical protein
MARVTYINNHHGSEGFRAAGTSEEISDEQAKALKKAKIVKIEKVEDEASARETKEDKGANTEETK